MKLTDFLMTELDGEVERSRKALEQIPSDKNDWKPHERSMPFGYLAELVATMPSWVAMTIERDELDLRPKDGSSVRRGPFKSNAEYLAALDSTAKEARAALGKTSDDHLMTPWRLLVAGRVVSELPRQKMIQETFNHWAHHRGQMTVYLRLTGAKVPALYGPSADDASF